MSERLGPRVFGHDHGQPFLGREFSAEPDYSDEIAREIDDEIRRIVESAHQRAKDILTEKRDALGTISEILLKRETIEKEEFVALLDGKTEEEVFGPDQPAAPPDVPGTPAAPERPTGDRKRVGSSPLPEVRSPVTPLSPTGQRSSGAIRDGTARPATPDGLSPMARGR